MAQRRVIWTQTAWKQRREVLRFWNQRNGSVAYSKKVVSQIRSRTKLIAKNPQMFREADYSGLRMCPLGHFSLFYTIAENKIIVVAFWDNRNDPEELEQLLLT